MPIGASPKTGCETMVYILILVHGLAMTWSIEFTLLLLYTAFFFLFELPFSIKSHFCQFLAYMLQIEEKVVLQDIIYNIDVLSILCLEPTFQLNYL